MRFYELDAGRITLDGVDIASVPRSGLRANIGMVLQDTWLFHGTIRDNIAYGRPDATEAEIHAAAEATYVDRFVHSLPDGYDTVIDEEGSNISAGEKQLLTIARAFLADPALLILDEATSSVDTRTEVLVQRAMAALRIGPDQLRDRAPALHHPRRRRDLGDGERRDRRAGKPPRAARFTAATTGRSTTPSSPRRSTRTWCRPRLVQCLREPAPLTEFPRPLRVERRARLLATLGPAVPWTTLRTDGALPASAPMRESPIDARSLGDGVRGCAASPG